MEISSRKAERSRGKKLPFANTAACVVTIGKGAIRSMPEKEEVPVLLCPAAQRERGGFLTAGQALPGDRGSIPSRNSRVFS